MNESEQLANPLFTEEIVYSLPYAGVIQKDLAYASGERRFDLYLPENEAENRPDEIDTPAPVVIFVTGYPDPGFESMLGMKQKEIPSYRSWARLLAASGFAAITYSNESPTDDLPVLIEYLESNGAELNIDMGKIAVWSCSGNVPNALDFVQKQSKVCCAVFNYGLMLDLNESTEVKDAAQQFRFANPIDGEYEFPLRCAFMLVKAGKDNFPGVNVSMDAFAEAAESHRCEIEYHEHPEGVHGYDVLDDSEVSVNLIKQQLNFLTAHLLA